MLKYENNNIDFNKDNSSLSIYFRDSGVNISDMETAINVNDKWFKINLTRKSEDCIQMGNDDVFGKYVEIEFSGQSDDLPLNIDIGLVCFGDVIVLLSKIENTGTETLKLNDFALVKNALVKFNEDIEEHTDEINAHIAHGIAHPTVVPLIVKDENGNKKDFHANSNGMATLTDNTSAFLIGFITGTSGRPIISVNYNHESDEVRIDGITKFNGIELSPNESIDTDYLILQAGLNPFDLLESYAGMIEKIEPYKKKDAPIGWCSWYAIRLPINSDFTMENARVVSDRFKGLGMDIMLLDHGWQTGDICGDWDEDEKDFGRGYYGGLKGLANDLKNKGLKLGVWIAPTEVAETSKLFTEHPDWVLRDKDGKPQETWKWYWTPNPLEYQLDATNPDAYQYIVETFQRLREKGAVYFKIDFIAGCSGENLYPIDPKAVRGWTPLQKAMQAIREGAGEDAYIRYCQTPPLLSYRLADGVYATNDTLDAGATTWNTLREVFKMSSAEYYLHGLYNHEACDLSIRTHAGTEECRLRVMMLTLSGSSIMFSDDLTKLPEERIIMMQQCMPPFPKPARPINLFKSPMPDIWHYHCSSASIEWDLVALFNFDENQRQFNISMSDIGLDGEEYIIREFWTEEFIGVKSKSVELIVPGLSARLYSFWKKSDKEIQFVGTNLHLSQGEAELVNIVSDGDRYNRLSGTFKRAKGINGKAYFYCSDPHRGIGSSFPIKQQNGSIWEMELSFDNVSELSWEVS